MKCAPDTKKPAVAIGGDDLVEEVMTRKHGEN